ncbi:MAG: zf-HC2 domain-containing protein [Candidatus Dormiibacterota bacterium]
MNSVDCERWSGDLALASMGGLDAGERMALDAHLSGCPDCRRELAELESVSKALVLADPIQVDPSFQREPRAGSAGPPIPVPVPVPPLRSRRRFRWAPGGLGVAAVLAGASLLWLGPLSTHGITIPLLGTKDVQATAVLTAEHWGTDLSLQVAGQPAGGVYHVSMESTAGRWWQAGSYHSENGSVHVELACGVNPTKVDRIWIENSSGHLVLHAYIG